MSTDDDGRSRPDGLPEKIGEALGFIVIVVVVAGIAWMMARASGVM
jgi:hypothetical protein